MDIVLIAYDSLGVRSMATFIETDNVSIMIDPSAALGPRRYGLPPHPIEVARLHELLDNIMSYTENAQVVIITHYHYDHHNPNMPEMLKGKLLLVKHPQSFINISQKIRAARFLKILKESNSPSKIEYADDRIFKFEGTLIRISPPVPHGINDRLGYVIMVTIDDDGERLLFTSDVEGPPLEIQRDLIIRENPKIILLDGPMTYMLGYRYPRKALDNVMNNLHEIISKTHVETIVIDHHFMRDLNYSNYLSEIKARSPRKIQLISAAEYMGMTPTLLEARRKELYFTHPVNTP